MQEWREQLRRKEKPSLWNELNRRRLPFIVRIVLYETVPACPSLRSWKQNHNSIDDGWLYTSLPLESPLNIVTARTRSALLNLVVRAVAKSHKFRPIGLLPAKEARCAPSTRYGIEVLRDRSRLIFENTKGLLIFVVPITSWKKRG